MKKIITCLLLFIVSFQLFAQSWQYNNNRIAISFDGNSTADNQYY